jgi:hypothetical protein
MRECAVSVIVAAMLSTAVAAQEATAPSGPSASPAPNGSSAGVQPAEPADAQAEAAAVRPVTITGGVDFTTSYVFRGIPQEHDGFIAQPWFDLGATIYRGSGAVSSLSVNVGNWHSQHSGPTGRWYEADYYASATLAVGRLKPGALFTSYTSPNDRFNSVYELAAVLAYDDSGSRFPLSPRAVVAFELQGQADGGADQGRYLELGIRPSVKLARALSLAVPVKIGLSLADYYEGPLGNDRFGFFSTGVIGSVPLTSGSVSWDIHGGVDLLWFGDNLKLANGDGFKPVGSIGIGFSY